MKYLVIKTTKNGIQYKRYKCIDGWSNTKIGCWEFSEAGAKKIADRLNKQYGYDQQSYPKKIHFNIMAVAS